MIRSSPVIDRAPAATGYLRKRILGDFLKRGQLRGRLGNAETRVATLNELTILELKGLDPQTEFFIPARMARTEGPIFPDIGVLTKGTLTPVEFVEFIRLRNLASIPERTRVIQNAYPGVPVRFVIVDQ